MLTDRNNKYVDNLRDSSNEMASFKNSLTADIHTMQRTYELLNPESANAFVTSLEQCQGRFVYTCSSAFQGNVISSTCNSVLVTGLGKSGVVAKRMAVSLTSTGA